MILSNGEIINGIKQGYFEIDPLPHLDGAKEPFNTTAIDLRLGTEIRVVNEQKNPVAIDLTTSGIANFLKDHTKAISISNDQPYKLMPNNFILGQTLERVNFPLNLDRCFSARVEGKSSLARCGILVHFTAPTIHAGFKGYITLEIINLGHYSFLLTPGMFVCQLIIEEVAGRPIDAPNQFSGQVSPVGNPGK